MQKDGFVTEDGYWRYEGLQYLGEGYDFTVFADDAYVTQEQAAAMTKEDLKHFLHFRPAFMLELISIGDTLPPSETKMDKWMDAGAQLGWLVDPYNRRVYIYEAGKPIRVESDDKVLGTGSIEGFVLDLLLVWNRLTR